MEVSFSDGQASFRAFFLWNLPGLIILTACGVLLAEFIPDPDNPPFWLAGLPPAAISLVFKAAWGFSKKLDSLGVCLALCSCLVAILINNDDRIRPQVSQFVFPIMLAIGGLVTFIGKSAPMDLQILLDWEWNESDLLLLLSKRSQASQPME